MIITKDGSIIDSLQYKNEDELQETIINIPQLLRKDEDLLSIKREVQTDAGPIDVLMIDKRGKLTVVEVKLDRNGESRRKVAAQIIDYVSSISTYSYFELDEATDGRLDEIVKTLPDPENLPATIENNLRSGNVRLVIAIDKSNDDLLRIMQFLEEHTDFELDLIEIQKIAKDNELFYQTNTIIKSSANENQRQSEHRANPILDEVQELWNNSHSPKSVDSAFSYRQVRMPGWKNTVHYEFLKQNRNNFVEVRLDNEISPSSEIAKQVSAAMEQFENQEIAGYQLSVYRNKTGVIRQLAAHIDLEDATSNSCVVMEKLIELTKESIDKVFNTL